MAQLLASIGYDDWFGGAGDAYGLDPSVGGTERFYTAADILRRAQERNARGNAPLQIVTPALTPDIYAYHQIPNQVPNASGVIHTMVDPATTAVVLSANQNTDRTLPLLLLGILAFIVLRK